MKIYSFCFSGGPPGEVDSDNESHMSDATHMSVDDDESICGDGGLHCSVD